MDQFLETVQKKPFVFGAVAGFVETTFMYPTVVWGLSRQLKKPLPSTWKGFYQGYSANLMVMVPTFATLIGTSAYLKERAYKRQGERKMDPVTALKISFISALFATVYMNPVEVMTVKQRINPTHTMRDVAKKVIVEEGLRTFYRGFTVATGRNFLYSLGMNFAPTLFQTKEHKSDLMFLFVATALAGGVAGISSQPLHVLNAKIKAGTKPQSALLLAKELHKTEGAKALVKGAVPRMCRTGFGSGILVSVYTFLQKREEL